MASSKRCHIVDCDCGFPMKIEDELEVKLENPTVFPPEVTKIIFSFLDIEHLKPCRLVCKYWNLYGAQLLKSHSMVSCENEEQTEAFLDVLEESTKLRLPSPFQEISVCYKDGASYGLKERWSQVRLSPSRMLLRLWDDERSEVPIKILLDCSKFLSTLELDLRLSDEGVFPLKDKFGLLESFPHLTSLSVTFDPEIYWVDSFIHEIIQGAPNLKELTVKGRKQVTDKVWISVLKVLHGKSLASLRLSFEEITRVVGHHLIHVRAPHLTSLVIEAESVGDQGKCLLKLLQKLAGSLQTLKLRTCSEVNLHQFEEDFPHCRSLKELYVEIFDLRGHLLQKTPRLEKLSFKQVESVGDLGGSSTKTSGSIRCLSVQDLPWEFGEFGDTISSLYKHFPNVQTFSLDSNALALYDKLVWGKDFSLDWVWVLRGLEVSLKEPTTFRDLSGFNCLKGITKLSLKNVDEVDGSISDLDFGNFPILEVLQFDWEVGLDFKKFAENVKHLKAVYVRGCCLWKLEPENYKEAFFNHLSNGRCGCKVEII